MTNSISTAKCPSILASGKYGMSQRRSIIDDSKEYIFVKLTDSAFRAIEEYQRNAQSKRLQKGQCAKIQFIGNAGVIQFPPTADNSTSNGSSSDGRKFGFAIDDVEGSLECVQQSGTDLDVLGSLSYRMRIHANDDVYDTTRTKMAIAEETEKSKCIREIKPNQTDIGRKVKRPVSAASIQAYSNGTSSLLNGNGLSSGGGNNISINGSSSYLSNSNNNHISSSSNSNSRNKLSTTTLNQHSPPLGGAGGGVNGTGVGVNGSRLLSNNSTQRSSPNPSLIGGSGTVGGGNNRYGSPSNLASSNLSTSSSNLLNGAGGISPPGSGNNTLSGPLNSQQKKSMVNGANSRANNAAVGKGSLGNSGKANGTSNGKTPDVSRRKIRERLIHLLALKPFKKPELYSRLQNEGLAQRERQLISTILKDISTLSRDNTYNLKRSMWNDVDENWPFFSEQEIQQLKRRKPQNLTPPTSSDAGSSISGQSPTSSTHTGSPPPLMTTSNMNGIGGGGGGIKRTSLEPDFYDGALALGMQSKKQRISHYKKDCSSSGSNSMISSNFGAGARIGLGAGNNTNGSSYNQNHKSASATYSPHMYNANCTDENSGNSDLSFNVLNNMDGFIQNTAAVGGDLSYSGRSKTTSGTNKSSRNTTGGTNCNNNNVNNVTSHTSSKEKRNSGVSNSSSGYGSNRESSSSSAMRRKNSPTPYANNFVPETKISPNSSVSNSSSRLNKPQQMQKHQKQTSPNYNSSLNNHYPQKLSNNNSINNNGAIPNIHDEFSTSLAPPTSQASTANHNANLTSSRARHHSSSSGVTNGRSGSESSSSKHTRSSTPTQKNFNNHSNNNSSSKTTLSTAYITQQLQTNNNQQHLHQLHQQQDDQQPLLNDDCITPQTASHSSQQSQQQEHSSPTQQIAAAASTFSLTNHSTSSGDAPRYDFSSYTPITSIEQRRKYKTEFESDYDEYRKLLAQIESVGHRFRELADRLSRVQQGCIDYYNIKDQIVSEYNRIRKEEAINRDKQRFDYLHMKLAHIKQLVMDYDKKLTSGLATPTINANQQQQQKQVSPNPQQQVTVTNNPAHLSPMLQSSGESNHSPPLMIVNSSTVNTKNSSTSSLPSHARKSSKHHQKNHQQQHQELYMQHHEPETIQMVDDNDDDNEEETAMKYHQDPYNRYEAGDNLNQQQEVASPANSIHAEKQQQQNEQQHHESPPQHPGNQNTNDSDSDSDSSSSSSSNGDDNSDDNSDASDDENSDDDSNDDDNDDQ